MVPMRPNESDATPPPIASVLSLLGLLPSGNLFASESLDRRVRSMGLIWPMMLAVLIPACGFMLPPVLAGKTLPFGLLAILLIPVLGWWASKAIESKSVRPHVAARVHAGLSFLFGLAVTKLMADAFLALDPALAWVVSGGAALVIIVAFSRLTSSTIAFAMGFALPGLPFIGGPIGWAALLTLLACLIFVVVKLARVDSASEVRRWQADQDALRSSRLLDEVEQNSPAWFWETDRHGNIQYISPKVALWVGFDADGMAGKPLTIIGSDAQPSLGVGERSLGFYLSTRTAFSDLAVTSVADGAERWWSVSGRPVTDKFGQYRGFIGTGSDLTEQRRSEAEVVKLARFDTLTGLANRAETAKLLNQALAGQPGRVRPNGLMLIDLDRFKAVNDSLGHPAGDELLKQVAKRLTQVIDSHGLVGRLGGDEFKVVLPGISDRLALTQLADAIIGDVSKSYKIGDDNVSIGASIGIALSPEDGSTSEELVRNADLALYAAKAAGRGVHRFYELGMHSAAEERRKLDEDMRGALLRGEFRLVYQPIVSLEKEKIIGFEALIRWQHPTRGPVSPADFIPIAEENGLIEAIGEWTLRQACDEAAQWAVDARVAVNISATQFVNPKFPDLVANCLAQSGLARERLEIEITEGVFVSESEATDRQFALIKKLGVRLVLDDFGTGYSSLGYLKRAPFDKIKIDQSFVRGASLGENRNAAIIKAIVTLAEALNLETTAEGVETQDEIDFIRNLGCSHIQGFVFGRPLEVDVLREQLGTRGADAQRVGHKSTREARLRIFRAAQMTISGRPHPVRLRNISNGGVMVEGPAWVTKGTPVEVDITDDVTIAGKVRWADDGRIGIQFDDPVELSKLMPQAKQAS